MYCWSIVGILFFFQEDFANGSAVSGVFTVNGELCIDMGRPQPRGKLTLYFAQCLCFEAKFCTDNFEMFKNCVPVVERVEGERVVEYLKYRHLARYMIRRP